ncbi:MAG: hypothetical protein IJ217_03160 [Clostridia bacterium]|nr:hypothetical protein [Clostridia bacterium]
MSYSHTKIVSRWSKHQMVFNEKVEEQDRTVYKKEYRKNKEEERIQFKREMDVILRLFRELYTAELSEKTMEKIMAKFSIPTAKICVITRLGNELEARDIDKSYWIAVAKKEFP